MKLPSKINSIFLAGKIKSLLLFIVIVLISVFISPAHALELYVDPATDQIYTSPGKNRVKLGKFKQVDKEETQKPSEEFVKMEESLDKKIEEAKVIEERLDEKQQAMKDAEQEMLAKAEEQENSVAGKKWYDRIKVGGYTQFRVNEGLSGDYENLSSPGDKSIESDKNFYIRRARLVFSGDITDHLKFYMQTEFAGGNVKVRDMYGDIYFDKKKEFRIRPGLSKIPNSFELLQSSRNRLALERADALSSGVRNERDTGIFFMWTPKHIQERFKELSNSTLKGTGDYGVIAFGAYNGQGINEKDKNKNVHLAARVTYPFKFDNGQFFEAGVFGYTGKFVPTVGTNNGAGITTDPSFDNKGTRDERIGLHAIWYPQPFGLQAEWNWGNSPQLNDDRTKIESASIKGGYVQAMYLIESKWGKFIPYVKWQTYNGAEKFSTNAPYSKVRETEVGLEWQVRPEIELLAAYSNMDVRTNVNTLEQVKNANLMRFQIQWKY